MTADGALTEAGSAMRSAIERSTEEMAVGPWEVLGESGTARLRELGAPLVAGAIARGAFPAGVFA
jgi:hypothetical protein